MRPQQSEMYDLLTQSRLFIPIQAPVYILPILPILHILCMTERRCPPGVDQMDRDGPDPGVSKSSKPTDFPHTQNVRV